MRWGAPVLPGRASRVRHQVVGCAIALAMITYLDRACLATLAPSIMRDLSLSRDQMAYVFSAFSLAYTLFELPTAWLADRRGTRSLLTRIVLWWSAFTMATAAAAGFVSLLITRFLFGVGEAGAWPCVARTFSRWVPQVERGVVQGLFFAGAHLAAGLTPLAVIALEPYLGWRPIFGLFGTLGVIWAVVWHRWFRDEPEEHAGVNRLELEQIVAGRGPEGSRHAGWDSWKRLLTSRNTLPLCLSYFPNSGAFYFCITWMPTYVKELHRFSAAVLGLLSGLPLILSVAGDLCGGAVSDFATRRFGARLGRCGLGVGGSVLAGAAMICAGAVHQPILIVILVSLALTSAMFTLVASWSTCLDIGGRHVGVVSAAMNTSGQIGSLLNPLMVAFLLNRFGSWSAPLFAMGGLFLLGAVCWALIRPDRPIFG